MSMFPHSITLYNTDIERHPDLTETPVNHITVLHGVFVDATKAVNVRTSGLEGADAVSVIIPADVEALDGVTHEPKEYIGAMEYWAAEDKSGYWTLQPSQNAFFVVGEVVEPDASFEQLSLSHDGVHTITKVDDKRVGGLPHWEVGGA